MLQRIRDWFFTIPFLIAFGLTLVVFDISGRAVRPFSLRAFERVMAGLQFTLMSVFRICGTRIEVERSEKVKPNTGYAIISNHQSLFDIALIGGILFSNYPKYVAKRELGRGIPSVSLNLRWGGNALIDRTDRRQAMNAIRSMAEVAQERNVSVAIFPEGTRSRDGTLGEFKRAGSHTLLTAADRLPVVPVAVDGSYRLLENNLLPVPYGVRVRIRIGDPIPRHPGDAGDVVAQVREFISATLEEWRREGV